MPFLNEDFERIPDMDKLWLLEKEAEWYAEWQQWLEEDKRSRLPAKIEILTPFPKLEKHEIQPNVFPF